MRRILLLAGVLAVLCTAGRAQAVIHLEEAPPADSSAVWGDQAKRLPPLFWYEYSSERQSRFFMLMMLYWEGQNPERTYRSIVPLFYQRQNHERRTTTWISPLFYWRSTPYSKAGYVPPFYYEKGARVMRVGTPPLFWYGRTDDDITSYLLPLYFYNRLDGVRMLATPVGGAWGSYDDWQGFVGPYYWRNAHTSRLDLDAHVLFPLYWHLDTGRARTHVVGPAFSQTRQTGRGTARAYGLAPLFYRRTNPDGASTTVTPLSVYERSDRSHRLLVTPAGGYHRSGPRLIGVWGPVIFSSERDDHRTWLVLPGLWSHHQIGEYRAWGLLPAYYSKHDSGKTYAGVLPVFYHYNYRRPDGKRERSTLLLPLFSYRERPGSLTFLSPLYVQTRHPGDRRIMALWMWWDHKWRSGRSTTMLPLFHWSREESTRELVTPLGGFKTRPGYHRWMWGPVYHRKHERDGAVENIVFPLYFNVRYRTYQTLVIPPYYRHREGPEFTEGLMPFWYHHAYLGRTTTWVLPFFYTQLDEFEKTYSFWTPIGGYWRSRNPRAWRALMFNLYLANGPAKHTTSLLPLFWYDWDHGTQTVVVPPFFTRRGDDSLTVGTLPLFYYHRKPRSTTFVSPLALRFSSGKDRSTWVIPPLLTVHHDGPHGHVGVYGPLVDVAHDDSRSTVLFPLFRYNRSGEDASLMALPFFWWLRHGEQTRGFMGVGYWNSATGTRIWPLYVRLKQHDEQTGEVRRTGEVFFPMYWRYTTKDRDVMVIPPYYRVERSDGSRLAGIAPVFSHETRPKGKSWSVLGDLVGYEKKGPYRRLTLLFGFHIPLKRTETASARAAEEAPRVAAYDDRLTRRLAHRQPALEY